MSWTASNGATSYEYCYDRTNDNACDGEAWLSAQANTSVALSGLLKGTTYYWQVRARNAAGTTEASDGWWAFTTQVSLPGTFDKATPAKGATAQPSSLALSWAASSGAISYEYCYDRTNNNACDGETWVSAQANTSAELSGLLSGATYYWQVRARNAAGTTEASDGWWAFTILAGLPQPFDKSTPAKNASAQPSSLTLSWAASNGATSYEYCYDQTNNNACDGEAWISAQANTSVALSGLLKGTTYYWQVRARNVVGTTEASDGWWAFTTQVSLPGAFDKATPAKGATAQPNSLALSWTASNGATSYEYCYDRTNDNSCEGAAWVSAQANTSVALSGLLKDTTYYWQVRARNAAGTTEAGDDWWAFTTQVSLPEVFHKSAPAKGATAQPSSLTLSWAASSGAISYEYCYDQTNDSACDGETWVSTQSNTRAGLSGLSKGTTYYWQVRARNAAGTTEASDSWWTFTTQPDQLGVMTIYLPLMIR